MPRVGESPIRRLQDLRVEYAKAENTLRSLRVRIDALSLIVNPKKTTNNRWESLTNCICIPR